MGEPFIVQLANRPGELGHLARALGMRGISIMQIAGSSAGDVSCAMLTTDNDTQTSEVLHSMGLDFVTGSTLIVEVDDKPGGLGELTARLGDGGVNIRGFCIIGRRDCHAEVALAVDDEVKAREILGLPTVHMLAAAR